MDLTTEEEIRTVLPLLVGKVITLKFMRGTIICNCEGQFHCSPVEDWIFILSSTNLHIQFEFQDIINVSKDTIVLRST